MNESYDLQGGRNSKLEMSNLEYLLTSHLTSITSHFIYF